MKLHLTGLLNLILRYIVYVFKILNHILRMLWIYVSMKQSFNLQISCDKFSDMAEETQRFFYHTPKTRELDNLLGDIYHKILGIFFMLVYIFHGISFLNTMM